MLPALVELVGPGGVYEPIVAVYRSLPRRICCVASPVNVLVMFEFNSLNVPSNWPVKVTVPDRPDARSCKNSVSVYALAVKVSGAAGDAVLYVRRLVATTSES